MSHRGQSGSGGGSFGGGSGDNETFSSSSSNRFPPGAPPQVIGNRTEGRRLMVHQEVLRDQASEVQPPTVTREWELMQVARPVDVHTHRIEVPVVQELRTVVPKIQVRETVKQVQKDEPQYIEKPVDVIHQKIVDTYVEKPVVSGTAIKYVPKVDVHERKVLVTKPEIKWVEKYVDVPQIKEVVRYVESDRNVEKVIRYVPKGSLMTPVPPPGEGTRAGDPILELMPGPGALGVSESFATQKPGELVEVGESAGPESVGESGKPEVVTGAADFGEERRRARAAIVGPAPAQASPRTVPLTSSGRPAAAVRRSYTPMSAPVMSYYSNSRVTATNSMSPPFSQLQQPLTTSPVFARSVDPPPSVGVTRHLFSQSPLVPPSQTADLSLQQSVHAASAFRSGESTKIVSISPRNIPTTFVPQSSHQRPPCSLPTASQHLRGVPMSTVTTSQQLRGVPMPTVTTSQQLRGVPMSTVTTSQQLRGVALAEQFRGVTLSATALTPATTAVSRRSTAVTPLTAAFASPSSSVSTSSLSDTSSVLSRRSYSTDASSIKSKSTSARSSRYPSSFSSSPTSYSIAARAEEAAPSSTYLARLRDCCDARSWCRSTPRSNSPKSFAALVEEAHHRKQRERVRSVWEEVVEAFGCAMTDDNASPVIRPSNAATANNNPNHFFLHTSPPPPLDYHLSASTDESATMHHAHTNMPSPRTDFGHVPPGHFVTPVFYEA